MPGRDLEAARRRFWDRYVQEAHRQGVPQRQVKCYVLHAQRYIDTHSSKTGFYPATADTSEKLHHAKQEVSDGIEETTGQS